MNLNQHQPFPVLIVGGGVASLGSALALGDLAGDRCQCDAAGPRARFCRRPMRVRAAFAYSGARHYPLEDIARDIGAELKRDAFKWVDPAGRVVHTDAGEQLAYDALIPGAWARTVPRLCADNRRPAAKSEQLHRELISGRLEP